MKANLHWIKKLLQVSFVPAEIRPGKSRPEMYMVPPKQKPTSLHVLLVFAPVVWLCHKKKLKNLEKTKKPKEKQYSRTLAKAKIQKSKKPRENQKKQKKQKKQYSRTLAKVKMQKSKKPRENQKNQKKQYSRTLAKVKMQKSKKPRENQKKQKKQYSRSLEMGSTDQSSGILFFFCFFWFSRGFFDFCIFPFPRVLEYCFFFFVFFGFLEVFLIFAFFLFQESWNIVFFVFFVFFGFLEVFWVRFFMLKMHYILDDVC